MQVCEGPVEPGEGAVVGEGEVDQAPVHRHVRHRDHLGDGARHKNLVEGPIKVIEVPFVG